MPNSFPCALPAAGEGRLAGTLTAFRRDVLRPGLEHGEQPVEGGDGRDIGDAVDAFRPEVALEGGDDGLGLRRRSSPRAMPYP